MLVELLTIGKVPLVLDTPLNKHTWRARDAYGKEHKINTRWIIATLKCYNYFHSFGWTENLFVLQGKD